MAGTRGMLGAEATLNYNTATYNSPTWAAVPSVSDLKMGNKWDKGESAARYSRMKTQLKTMLDAPITGKIRTAVAGDAIYTDIITALLAPDTVINVMILNYTTSTNGAFGFMFDAQVFQGEEDQSLGAVIYDEIEIAPAPTTNAPQYAIVTNAAPVFTAF